MSVRPSSEVFAGTVGATIPAVSMPKADYLIDPARFPSEGNWAFCRFDSEEIPALRLGFQRGGFNGGFFERDPSPRYLQLHLEVMSRAGAILWLPSGVYPADEVISDPHDMAIRLDHSGRSVFRFAGWPTIDCHVVSEDGELEASLRFALRAVTVLPDSLLPYCTFGMWESMGGVVGSIRHRDRTVAVNGTVFFDHTRVLPARHAAIPRHMYVYTTLYFEDGSGLFGYHSVDALGRPIDGYCFNVYLDPAGHGRLLEDSTLRELVLDADGIAKSWEIVCSAPEFSLRVTIGVRDHPILECWGSQKAPMSRKDYSIIPLVLDGTAQVSMPGRSTELKAYGLAEYFNADLWPADQAATQYAPGIVTPGVPTPGEPTPDPLKPEPG